MRCVERARSLVTRGRAGGRAGGRDKPQLSSTNRMVWCGVVWCGVVCTPIAQDIAFNIVNKEWEYSFKRGFKCTFERGCAMAHARRPHLSSSSSSSSRVYGTYLAAAAGAGSCTCISTSIEHAIGARLAPCVFIRARWPAGLVQTCGARLVTQCTQLLGGVLEY
jgi:hypothetical protein